MTTTITTTLAIAIEDFGGPHVLRPEQTALSALGAHDVLIAVAAAGVNRPDVLQRMGAYPVPPDASPIPGLEVAGTIAEIGSAVSGFAIGDRVCALVNGGGYAHHALAPAAQCLPIPARLSFIEAAALPETTFTVWTNVFERARLRPGESLLVHGGASGIGTTAIQIARALGSTVYATAGGHAKCAACEKLGAKRCVDYTTDDFLPIVLEGTDGRGVDVILDIVGAPYLERNLELLAMDGRLTLIGVMGGAQAPVSLHTIMRKRLWITGSTLRPRTPADKAAIAQNVREHVWPLIESGAFTPLIDRTYPLAQAAEAHRRMEAGEIIGKVVLVV
jgi:NADPH2:quinone reductase